MTGKIDNCQCTCANTFSGENCQLAPCTIGPSNKKCYNNGTLTGKTDGINNESCGCLCVGMFSGTNCELLPCTSGPPSNQTCENGGVVTGKTNGTNHKNCGCSCAKGYGGTNCEIALPCTVGQDDKPCLNGGQPIGTATNCGCKCDENAYAGLHCEMDILYDCDIHYAARWDTAQELYVRWTSLDLISHDPNIFDIHAFEQVVSARYRFESTKPVCKCPDNDHIQTNGQQIICPCPSWDVIENISIVSDDRNIPEINTITVVFDVVHVSLYEDMSLQKIIVLNATGVQSDAAPILAKNFGALVRIKPVDVHINVVNVKKENEQVALTESLDGKWNSVGLSRLRLNVTVAFEHDHELHLPLQTMMEETPFLSWFAVELRTIFNLDDNQKLRTYGYPLFRGVENIYPEIHWTYNEWYPPKPESCRYDTDDFILMMMNEMWCWFRDLPTLVHIIVTSSFGGLSLLITLLILFSNYKSQQRFCCDTCRCCTEMGRRCCGCLPCCPCCGCCRCCVVDLGETKDLWFDFSGCKNNCRGEDMDDEDRFTSVHPSITIKGRTKSVTLQMSKIVTVKQRPVGAPTHVIEEMFSFEDVSLFVGLVLILLVFLFFFFFDMVCFVLHFVDCRSYILFLYLNICYAFFRLSIL